MPDESVLLHHTADLYEPFDPNELRRLRTFHDDVESFLASAFFKDLKLSATVGVDMEKTGASEELEYPGEEAVHAVSGLFRSLYDQHEKTSFHPTTNLLRSHIVGHDSEYQEQGLDELRVIGKWHKQALKNHGLLIQMNGQPLTPTRLIEIFLYGRYLHKDQDKIALLESFAPIAILQLEFLTTMQMLSKLYRCVGQEVVRPVLDEPSLADSALAA